MQPALGGASKDLAAVIRTLSGVAAPAGNEDRLGALVEARLRELGLTPRVDRLGQVAVEFGRADADRCILVSAHLDELGLVVRRIDNDGMLRVHRLGGMPERVLPGLRVIVHTRCADVPAVVGLKSHHLTLPEDKYVAKPATELYLDLGTHDAASVADVGVRVGDPVTYQPAWSDLAGGRFSGKSLDDRVGVAALLAYVERLVAEPPAHRVVVAFTTQEEFHVRGTLALVAMYQPDVVVNVDITPATDTPDLAGVGGVGLGGGPTLSRLSFHGRGTLGGLIPHPALVGAVETAAGNAGVQLQYDATVGVITDAAFVTMATADGIAAVGLGIPVRYTHSPVETAQLSDIEQCVELVAAAIPLVGEADLTRGAAQISSGGLA